MLEKMNIILLQYTTTYTFEVARINVSTTEM